MTVEDFALFFALLLLGGSAGVLAILIRPSLRRTVIDAALPLLATIAVGATFGSLYFSEVAGFTPCELCWYQRIAMYPLAVIGPLAAFRRDRNALTYVGLLSTIGFVIAIYHTQLQLFPDQSSFCEATSPCTVSPIKAVGWMTIPHMSAISFGLITSLAALSIRNPLQEAS